MYLGNTRADAVKINLERDLAHARSMLARARGTVERQNWQGKIRVLTLALRDLARQAAVNPRFTPGNRPADGRWFAEPAASATRSLPLVPPPVERTPDTSLTASVTKLAVPRTSTALETAPPSKTDALTSSSTAPSVAVTPAGLEPVTPAFVPESVQSAASDGVPWWVWVGGAWLAYKALRK
jgi:hypothetical protein